jgi:hypothetical protein
MVQCEVTIALVTLMRMLLYYSGYFYCSGYSTTQGTLLLRLLYYSGYSTTQGTPTAQVTLLLGLLYYLGYSYRSGYSVTLARIAAFYALKLTFLKVLGDIVALCATILAKYPLRPLNSGF